MIDSDFAKVDELLLKYAEGFARAVGQEVTASTREQWLQLAQDSTLWQQVCKLDANEQTSLPAELMTQHAELYLLNSVSEVLLNQLMPVVDLRTQHPHFFRALHLWVMRYWLAQLGTGSYSHEFQTVIEFIVRVLRPFDQYSGRSFERLLQEFAAAFETRVKQNLNQQHFIELQNQLTQCFQEFQKKTRVFEERVIQFETQLAQNASASQAARQLVNQAAAGGEVPDWTYQFLYEHWLRLFHLTLLKQGEQSELIQRGQKVLKDLIGAFKLKTFEEVQQGFATIISPLRNNIRELFASIVIDESVLDDFLDRLEAFHISILEGNELDIQWMLIDSQLEANKEAASKQEQRVVAQCKLGSWFQFATDGRQYSCRVVARNRELDFIVLVNYSGARVAALSFQEVEAALTSGQLKPLTLQSNLSDKVGELSQFLETQIININNQLEIKEKASRRRQVLERLEESRRERLEIKKSKREAEKRAKEIERQQLRQERIREQEQWLNKVGAGSTFVHHEMDDQIMQFALRLRNSGKMVFVDKKGVKVGEWLADELAELMIDGKVELLTSRQSNEQALEQIVANQRNQRRDIGVGA